MNINLFIYIYMKKFTVKVLSHLCLLFFVVFIFMTMGWDNEEWNGLDETNDKTFEDKFINRMYFTFVTFSTAGYGDISPKSKKLKIISCCVAFIMIIEIMSLIS
tara:strand:- start:662 stop:973 length:312 start_codon:yes stop_codon:yes gene_type:complete